MNPTTSAKGTLTRSDAVNVAHCVERCTVLGPGTRYVLWVQGCPLRCPGCINPEFLEFEERSWIHVEKLATSILELRGIDGVTYVGGEPFSQAEALASLSKQVKSAGLSVMAYSGFTLDELRSGRIARAETLLAEIDLLMDGRFERDLPTRRPWRGSDNQRLWTLSDRFKNKINHWNAPLGQQFEVSLKPGGAVEILGILPASLRTATSRQTEKTTWTD